MINLYIERMESLGELYVQNYSPEDTEDDDLRLVSELLSGLFEEKNPEKSRQYAQIANSYNEITRTSNFSQKNKNNSYQYQSTGQQPAHGKAVASLVLGIAGLICCGICGLIGLILAISAKNEGNNESRFRTGRHRLCTMGHWRDLCSHQRSIHSCDVLSIN